MLLPFVSLLFASGCPPDVAGAVVAVIVDSVYGMVIARTWPHMGKEGEKRCSPLRAHGDPAPAVVWIRCGLRVGTARDHATP